jgi:hypothetical protein
MTAARRNPPISDSVPRDVIIGQCSVKALGQPARGSERLAGRDGNYEADFLGCSAARGWDLTESR